MNEIIKMVEQKAGLSEEKARMAVEAVFSHLRKVLPAPLASQLDDYVAPDSGGGEQEARPGFVNRIAALFHKGL